MRKGNTVGHGGKALFSIFIVLVIFAGSENYANGIVKCDELSKAPKNHDGKTALLLMVPSQGLPAKKEEPIRRVYTVKDGDTFFDILKATGVSGEDALSIIKKTRPVFNVSKIKPGNEMQFLFSTADQSLIEFDYDISDLERLVINISGDRITARKVNLEKEEHIIASTDLAPERIDSLPVKLDKSGYAIRPQGEGQEARIEPASPGQRQIDIKVRKGHSLFDILSELGVSSSDIDIFTRSVKKVYNLADLKPDKTLSIWLTQDNPVKIRRLTYEIDDMNYLDVDGRNDSFIAKTRTLTRDIRYESAQGVIRNSLYGSAVAGGINPEIVIQLTDIFEHDINFFSDIQPGDTYSVLYEKYYVKDQFKGYGRVVAARFVNKGEKHAAFYYADKRKDIKGYYDENGCPMQKMFLQAPLKFRRISSGFSYHRLHPIFGYIRPHLGIDYAAPIGTPVRSLGPGRVIRMGWDRGLGKALRVKHPDGYVSIYGHLSRYAKGIDVGKKVDQGDTIAFVGMTGNTTGPHLHFMISHNNAYINPLKMKNVNGPPLRSSALADFKRIANVRIAMLENSSRTIAMRAPAVKRDREVQSAPRG